MHAHISSVGWKRVHWRYHGTEQNRSWYFHRRGWEGRGACLNIQCYPQCFVFRVSWDRFVFWTVTLADTDCLINIIYMYLASAASLLPLPCLKQLKWSISLSSSVDTVFCCRTHSLVSYNWDTMNSHRGTLLFIMYLVWQRMRCNWILEFLKAHRNVFPPTHKFKSVWRYTEATWWRFCCVFCSLCATGVILCSGTCAILWKGNELPCIN